MTNGERSTIVTGRDHAIVATGEVIDVHAFREGNAGVLERSSGSSRRHSCSMLLVAFACGASQRSQPPPSNLAKPQPITVRFAQGNELPASISDCPVDGEPTPDLFQPIVAFARAQLVDRLDKFGRNATTPVHAVLIAPGARHTFSGPGIEIEVEPHAHLGRLKVSNWWSGGGGASDFYCVEVVRDGEHRTVIIKPSYTAG